MPCPELMMHPLMERHVRILGDIEMWFAGVRKRHADRMQCGRGCAHCCYGLFDISFADGLLLAEGFGTLTAPQRQQVTARATPIQAVILKEAPQLEPLCFLDILPKSHVDRIIDAVHSPRCPFLGDSDHCLIYGHRPLACRLEGVPMVDTRDGLFGDWCELNFTGGVPAEAFADLAMDYYAVQAAEDISNEVLADLLLGRRDAELTVFIPSVVTEYDPFWERLVHAAPGDLPVRLAR